jgi:diguanylate cyclase (GGDEF)-like protein
MKPATSAAMPLGGAGAQVESLLLNGSLQSGALQLLKPFQKLARQAANSTESLLQAATQAAQGYGQAALVAGAVAAGVGVGAMVGGPLGLVMAGLASAMGFMKGFISVQAENRRLREENEQLREQASTDALTGLANRGAIFERLEREARRSVADGQALGVMMVDVDHFKSVNDTYGHAAGDAVLKEVSRRLRDSVRPGDSVGRYGGEELLVVVPDCDQTGLWLTAERLRTAVESAPVLTQVGAIRVTVSVGAAVGEFRQAANVANLVSSADEALYRAKRSGRNRVECAFMPQGVR